MFTLVTLQLAAAHLSAIITIAAHHLQYHPAVWLYAIQALTYFSATVIAYRTGHIAFIMVYMTSFILHILLCACHALGMG